MIRSEDGFAIEEAKNQIVIALPQTYSNLTSTVAPVSNRKEKLNDVELGLILNLVRKLYLEE